MTTISAPSEPYRAVRWWLISVAALIALMVLVGGATRLTESGLSIVEWKPVTGSVPPLSEAQWMAAFEAYKTIPQYRELNAGMSLSEFKEIFWWEWSHRLLGRFIGVAYLLPFLFFLWRGGLSGELKRRLWLLFGLGALQGAIGWWMVASGLTERVEVSQYRLATHLILACVIFAATLWTASRLRARAPIDVPPRIRIGALALLVLVLLQVYLGAVVAGLRAGLIYNTWPLIDGGLIPSAASLLHETPWWRNLFENTLTVQFNHRMVAYTIFVLALAHAVDVARSVRRGPVRTHALALAVAVTLQAVLGIATLLQAVPIGLALAHQAMAIVVLSIAAMHAQRMSAGADLARIELPATAR